MSAVVYIGNKEALPIRALPFISGGSLSPDIVAKALANTDHWTTRLEGVTAYHLLPDGEYAPMLPKEWDGIEAELQILSEKLRTTENFDQENYPEWRRESIPLLPASCFVWKEEFEQAFTRSYSPQKLILIDERPGDRDLNYAPRIPPELADVVMEGFAAITGQHNRDETNQIAPLSNRERDTLLVIIAALAKEANIPIEKISKSAELIANLTQQIGADVGATTIENHLKRIPDALVKRAK